MKKSLVALAALAATAAFAQSTVTITGIVDANYQSTKQPGDQSYSFVGQNGARTTAIKFTGTEDLGGGNTAVFMFAIDPSLIANNGNGLVAVQGTTAATTALAANGAAQGKGAIFNTPSGMVGNDEAYVGLSNAGMGTVKLGTNNNGIFQTFAAVSVMGTGIGTGYNTGIVPNITRMESSVRYESPTINGFSGTLQRGTGNDSQFGSVSSGVTTVTLRRPTVTDWSAQYANGPLTVKYGLNKSVATVNESSNPGVTTTLKLLGGAYDAGVAKVTYGTGTYTNDAAASTLDAKVSVMGVVVPFMGTYRFLAQSTYIKYSGGATTSYNLGEKNKITGWGLEKDLSKRTFVYLRGERADLAANAANGYVVNGAALSTVAWGATASTRTVTAAGISHSF